MQHPGSAPTPPPAELLDLSLDGPVPKANLAHVPLQVPRRRAQLISDLGQGVWVLISARSATRPRISTAPRRFARRPALLPAWARPGVCPRASASAA
jgi:hypothetical protein